MAPVDRTIFGYTRHMSFSVKRLTGLALLALAAAASARAETVSNLEKAHTAARDGFDGAGQIAFHAPSAPVVVPLPAWPIPRGKLDLPADYQVGVPLFAGDPERRKRFEESLRPQGHGTPSGLLLGDAIGSRVFGAVDPIFILAERAAGLVYNGTAVALNRTTGGQVHLDRFNEDSNVEKFHMEYRIEIDRASRRCRDSYPIRGGTHQQNSGQDQQVEQWRRECVGEMGSAALTAFERTMLDTVNVNMLQRTGEDCAKSKSCRRHPAVMALGLVVISGLGYFDGFHLANNFGSYRAFADIKAARGLISNFQNDGSVGRAVGLGVGRRFSGQEVYVEIYNDWMVDRGQMRRSTTGLRYSQRFETLKLPVLKWVTGIFRKAGRSAEPD